MTDADVDETKKADKEKAPDEMEKHMICGSKKLESMTYDEKMKHILNVVFEHPLYNEILERIKRCHEISKISSHAEDAYIGGPTGSGKTTVARKYKKLYPPHDEGEVTKVPVVMISIPSPATQKSIIVELLAALGDPCAEKGTNSVQTLRLKNFIKKCGVELIILDEFQHLIDRDSDKVMRTVADWLKVLIEDTGVPVILLGLEGENGGSSDTKTIFDANPQLGRRFANRMIMAPFGFITGEEKDAFRLFLEIVDKTLPLKKKSNLADIGMALRFYYASDGVIAYIMKLVRYGTAMVLQRNEDCLAMDILAEAFDEHVQSDKPHKINPFRCELHEIEKILASQKENDKESNIGANRRLRRSKRKTPISDILTT